MVPDHNSQKHKYSPRLRSTSTSSSPLFLSFRGMGLSARIMWLDAVRVETWFSPDAACERKRPAAEKPTNHGGHMQPPGRHITMASTAHVPEPAIKTACMHGTKGTLGSWSKDFVHHRGWAGKTGAAWDPTGNGGDGCREGWMEG